MAAETTSAAAGTDPDEADASAHRSLRPPDRSLGYLSWLAFRAASAALEERTMKYGISASQWAILFQLWHEDGISQHELSERLGMRDSSTGVVLRGLEKAAFVRRETNRRDRREILAFLTPRGKRLETLLMPATAEVEEQATRNLSQAEVGRLRWLLLRAMDNLSRDPLAAGGPSCLARPQVISKTS